MCYGDIDHGTDGYYREWAEREQERAMSEQQLLKRIDQLAMENARLEKKLLRVIDVLGRAILWTLSHADVKILLEDLNKS